MRLYDNGRLILCFQNLRLMKSLGLQTLLLTLNLLQLFVSRQKYSSMQLHTPPSPKMTHALVEARKCDGWQLASAPMLQYEGT